ncbi:MAG: 8-amino-7-oxononanoate synthase [Planctomyces sp.]|nr:8-amino-7-oxononanoate synthase [Planctomyces sp.]
MPIPWLDSELAAWREQGRWRRRRTCVPRGDGIVEVDGRTLLNLAGNDYLGLAGDPRLTEAAVEALEQAGVGARASALVSGRTDWHERLEQRLAEFEHAEAAVLFPSGYAANVGVISAVVGAQDAVFCDRLNHASLIDGCRLSRARLRVYRRPDLNELDDQLRAERNRRRRLIVTDSVFSMDGDAAPLPDLADLAERHDALLLVDEAHATGVLGPGGRGLVARFGIESDRCIRVGTLSKALGSIGGFVVGGQGLADWLWNTARTQVYSTAIPPAAAAAACAALEIVAAEPQRRERLLDASRSLRELLQSRGLRLPATDIPTPILPVIIGEEAATLAAAAELESRGLLVGAIRPPTVPAGASRLRISLHSQIDGARLESIADDVAAAAAVACGGSRSGQ